MWLLSQLEVELTCCAANVRNRTYSEDVDMRAQPPGTDSDYNQIIVQALEQYKRGDLNDSEYRRVLSEVSQPKHILSHSYFI